jgi:hypothetical protein
MVMRQGIILPPPPLCIKDKQVVSEERKEVNQTAKKDKVK